MDKTKETKNSLTLNSTSNCNQQQQSSCINSKPLNSDSGTSNNDSDLSSNGIGDLSTSATSSLQQTHDNKINLGCGSTKRQPTTPQTASAKTINNSNRISTNNITTASSSPLQNSAAFGTSSAAVASAATSSSSSSIKTLPRVAIASSSSTTILNGVQTSITTQLGTPLPSTLQQQANLANLINLNINTTTGGNFGVTVDPSTSVENLKKIVAKKLKVAKDRICLLHREKELQDGSLKDNNLMDGSRIILIPNVETGLLAQRPENTVMQALESLNDSQVNDFLSGKTPLNLSMRLGDHMMLIQLQLSTVNPANNPNAAHHHAGHGMHCASRLRSSQRASSRSNPAANGGGHHHSHSHHHHYHQHAQGAARNSTASNATNETSNSSSSGQQNLQMQQQQQIIKLRQSLGSAASAVASSSRIINNAPLNNPNQNAASSAPTPNTSGEVRAAPNNFAAPPRNPYKHSFGTVLSQSEYESLHKIVQSITGPLPSRNIPSRNAPSLAAAPVAVNGATATNGASAMTANSFHSVTPPNDATLLEQSPIKSLSNLVSSPIKTTSIKNIPIASPHTSSISSSAAAAAATAVLNPQATNNSSSAMAVSSPCQDPIAAKLTSCLCTRLNSSSSSHSSAKHCVDTSCLSRQDTIQVQKPIQHTQQRSAMVTSTPNMKTSISITPNSSASGSPAVGLLHKTAHNPITRVKQRHHHHHGYNHSHNHLYRPVNGSTNIKLQNATRYSSNSNDSGFGSDDSMHTTLPQTNGPSKAASVVATPSAAAATVASPSTSSATSSVTPMEFEETNNVTMTTDTRTLAEASRNLTQTLRKLSKEVFTNKIDLSPCTDESGVRRSSSGGGGGGVSSAGTGAVIESMKNHGKGIYSGTFSGTLNPALQDRYGRPKRDISTVIHILNDLLSATPQYSRGARISLETPAMSSSNSSNIVMEATNGHPSSRSKQMSSKHSSHTCPKCIKASAQSQALSQAAGSSSSTCSYGECNGHYSSKTPHVRQTSYPCCPDVPMACNAATPASSNAPPSSSGLMDKNVCSCRYRIHSETGEREREFTCQKCSHDMDNLKTKSKMNQIRLVMQQTKQKREARKLKGAPYGNRLSNGILAAASANNSSELSLNDTEMVEASGETNNKKSSAALNNATAATTLATATSAANTEVSPNHLVEEVDTAA